MPKLVIFREVTVMKKAGASKILNEPQIANASATVSPRFDATAAIDKATTMANVPIAIVKIRANLTCPSSVAEGLRYFR